MRIFSEFLSLYCSFLPPIQNQDTKLDDRRRAIVASRTENADLIEEERQLQEAIRLSKLPSCENETTSTFSPSPSSVIASSSSFFTPQFGDQNMILKKRKAEEDVTKDAIKAAKHAAALAYPNGGIRITRTPGRKYSANCIDLADIIHKDHLVSACVFSFFIANEELFPYLPLSHSSNAVPVSVPRLRY